ncbi:MAG: hypothetical protein ACJ74H_01825 [Thermoanaerobaculia bacterium]
MFTRISALLIVLWSGTLAAQPAAFPMKLGEAAATCFGGFKKPLNTTAPQLDDQAFVAGIVDVSDPKGDPALPGTNWMAKMFHNEFQTNVQEKWTAANLGQVFGLELDDATPPNIYVTATTSYGLYKNGSGVPLPGMFGPGGPGAVYRLDGTTGDITTFATLPNSGPGLGNIAYDRVNHQFFVTNFDNGLIHRLSSTGVPLSTFDFGVMNLGLADPGVAMAANYSSQNPNGVSGFRPLGTRPWAVGVFGGRLFFSIWGNDSRALPNMRNSIWSIAINPSNGDFAAGPALLEIDIPPVIPSGSPRYSSPVSDIAFSATGKLLIAERTMSHGDVGPGAVVTGSDGHQSRVREYIGGTGSWDAGKDLHVGGASGSIPNVRSNAEGGVDYGYETFNYATGTPPNARECDTTIWATAEQVLGPSGPFVYGLQAIPGAGNAYTSSGYTPASYAVDLNGVLTTQDKSRIGDVDIYRASCFPPTCLTMSNPKVLCTTDGSGDYLVTFDFKNETLQTIHHLFITGLPGLATANPNYVPVIPALAPGGIRTVGPIRIHGASAGPLTFTVSIHNAELVECCSTRITVELPRCLCAQVIADKPASCNYFGSSYTYTFSLQNLFNGPVSFISITPDPAGGPTFSPNLIPVSPPMLPGEIRTFTIKIGNVAPGKQACFRIGTHNENFEECCSIRRCITVPSCFDNPYEPNVFTDLQFTPEGLVLRSSDAKPGVTIPLPPSTGAVDLYWDVVEETLPNGSFLEQRLRGRVAEAAEGTLATTRSVVTPAGTELHTSFPALGTTRSRYEFLRDGVIVGTQGGVPIGGAPICNGCGGKLPTRDAHFSILQFTPASEENPPDCFEQGYRCLFAGYTFVEASPFTIANAATPFVADEIRVYPEDGVAGRLRLSALELEAQGPKRITLTSIAITTDCNANSIDDLIDIADGTSLDVDGNGVADECQGVGGDLTLSLNTGFDQNAGALLTRGAPDDDWRIANAVAAGPAKVVINPNRAWAAPLPDSAWISVSPNRGASNPLLENIDFENCFCIGSGAAAAELDLQLRADNFASVFLNDVPISGAGGGFSGLPLDVHLAGAVGGSGPFRVGRNCLRVRVNDTGGIVTGLDLSGTVRAAHGSCSQ